MSAFQSNRILARIAERHWMKKVAKCHECAAAKLCWLGRQDSNLRMPVPKTGALPLGDAPWRESGGL